MFPTGSSWRVVTMGQMMSDVKRVGPIAMGAGAFAVLATGSVFGFLVILVAVYVMYNAFKTS